MAGRSMKVEPNYATAKKHGILPCIIVHANMSAAIFRANLFTQGAYYHFMKFLEYEENSIFFFISAYVAPTTPHHLTERQWFPLSIGISSP
jgi:hypothetical protein